MTSHRGPVLVLFASLVIVMLGFGIVVPILPFYVKHFNAGGTELGLFMATYSIMQFIFAPLWGRLSDRIGRKPVLLAGMAGYALSFLLMGFAQNLPELFAARALAGILSSATLPTAFAFVSDTTTADKRSSGMGMMGAAMGLGMIFGPGLGGSLTRVTVPLPLGIDALMQRMVEEGVTLDLSLPFLVASLIALAAIPFVIFMLPESLPPERRVTHAQQKGGPSRFALLGDALRGPMAFLFVMSFLLAFALANLESVLGLFANDRFGMTPDQVGYIMVLIGLLSVIQQGVVIGPLTRAIGEERVLRWGLVVSILGFAGMAVLPQWWEMVLFACVFNTGNSLLRPSVASLISQRARGGQGAAMGLENSFMSLGRASGPIWAGAAYDMHYNLPYWTGAFMQSIAFVLSFFMLRGLKEDALPAPAGAEPSRPA